MSYKFELANSLDLDDRIGELTQARGRSLTITHNKAGAFNCVLPLEHEQALAVREVTTCIIVSLDEVVIWSGPVWTTNENVSASSATLEVGCVGWLQTLDKRVTRPAWNAGQPITYTEVDAGEIAMDLIERSNEDALIASAPSYVTPGPYEITQKRTRTYQPYSGVLASIEELTNIEAGFDMLVDPLTRQLNVYQQLRNESGARYELGKNITSVSRAVDSGRITNFITAYSSSAAPSVTDPFSCAEYGLFEEAQSISDVVNPGILAAYAGAELSVKSRPLAMLQFQPMAPDDPDSSLKIPRPFEDFFVGDTVKLTAKKGRMVIEDQLLRLFSFTVGETQNGMFGHMTNVQTVAQG